MNWIWLMIEQRNGLSMKYACFWGLKSWICKLHTAVSETEVVEKGGIIIYMQVGLWLSMYVIYILSFFDFGCLT